MKLAEFNNNLTNSLDKLGDKQKATLLGPEKLFPQWKCERTIQDMGEYGKSVQHMIGPFDNGFQVSVIKGPFTYGGPTKWEIAPMDRGRHFIGQALLDWQDDVKGHLTLSEVLKWCEKIEKL